MVKEADPITTDKPVDVAVIKGYGRRRFLGKAVKWTLGVSGGAGVLDAAIHRNEIFSFGSRLFEGYRKASTAKQELDKIFQSLAPEQELRDKVYRKGKQIDLESIMGQFPDGMDVEVFGIGDSNFFVKGEKNDKQGQDHLANPDDQPNSFLEQAGDALQPALKQVGIRSWTTHTYAVPGAPSGPGYEEETRKYGLLGPEQIKNKDFQDRLREGSQLKIVNIGVHGDDWRQLATDAFELATFFKTITNINIITDKQIAQLKTLKAKSDKIAQEYGMHILDSLAIIGQINEERIRNNLPGIKVVVNYPISNLHAEHIPFRTIVGDEATHPELSKVVKQVPNTDRYYLDLNQIPSGQQIAYIITDAIYKQLSSVLPQAATNPNLDIYSVVWMGLEQQKDLFYIDGHLNENGIKRVAQLFLGLFKKRTIAGTQVTLDKVATA